MEIRKKAKEKSVIFYYIFAIVIPCLLLGFLAFRGIKNDQALVEREQRRVLMDVSQQVFQELESYLASIENRFAELKISEESSANIIFRNNTFQQFANEHDAVEGIFILDNNKLALHNNGLLFFPDGYFPEEKVDLTAGNLKKGWQSEFREKDYSKALQIYNNTLKNSKNPETRGELLNAMARVQKKRGDYTSALSIYDSIYQNYSLINIQNNIPLGVVALLEKNSCYLHLKDTVSALKNSVTLLEKLATKNWDLEESYFYDYMEKANKTIVNCRSSQNDVTNSEIEKAETLQKNIQTYEKKTAHLLAFLNNRVTIAEHLRSTDKTGSHRRRHSINGKEYFYCVLPGDENYKRVILYNLDAMVENVIVASLEKRVTSTRFYWEVTGNNGEKLAGFDDIPGGLFPVNADFPVEQPPLTLTLYPEDSGLLATFFRSGGGFFFYIFIVVLIILGFGLIFTLQTVNKKIELSRMKSSFVSTVSHELKSPLTSIRQIAEIIVHKKVSEERQEKYFTMILQQSERLSHLIENILDYSKMEAGQKQFHFEKTDLLELTQNVVRSFHDRLAGKDFQVHVSGKPGVNDVNGDREALQQVLYNLIDNAVKYSGTSKKIEITIEPQGEWIDLKIRDYGVGISNEEQKKIFRRFYRVGDELTQTVKGTGIGLTIVKQIVEAHNGKIMIESTPVEGSLFQINIPVYRSNHTL